MRHYILAAVLAAGAWVGATAPASAVLISSGVTYDLEGQVDAVNPLVEHFALKITGINGALDTEGQRTGINAVAFNEVHNGATASGTMISPGGFTFVLSGLNSGGCQIQPGPNFYCFDNGAIPPTPTTAFAANSTQIMRFDVTLNAGNSWAGYAPDLKIDWVGNKTGGYDLVSKPISVDAGCPDCGINPTALVPEPASMALLGVGVLGMLAARRRTAIR